MSDLPDFVKSGDPARLIPVVADPKKEQRTLSVVLSAMRGVFEFRKAVFGSINVPAGKQARLEAWTEVTFAKGDRGDTKPPKQGRPDGLLILRTGKRKCVILVEAKIGNAEIEEEQLKEYLQTAIQHRIDTIVTISNQFVADPTHCPVSVPKNLAKNIGLFHWSWTYLLTQATLLLDGDEIQSPDQRYLLQEVVRYLSHDSSGINRFNRMNREWKDVVRKVKANASLNRNSEEVEKTVSSWHQEQRDLCLLMSQRLGRSLNLRLPRSHRTDPQKRLWDDSKVLASERKLRCTLRIPDAVADLDIVADLATQTVVCSMRLDAPKDKVKETSRVNWLTRQLKDTETQDVYVKAYRPRKAENTQALLSEVAEDPKVLSSNQGDTKKKSVAPTAFEIFYVKDLAGKFSGNKAFIDELEQAVPYFYEQIGQHLQSPPKKPPQMKISDSKSEGVVDES